MDNPWTEAPRRCRPILRRLAEGLPAFPSRAVAKNSQMLKARQHALRWLSEQGFVERGPRVTDLGREALAYREPMSNAWTDMELARLRKLFPTLGTEATALRIGRSRQAVQCKAWELRIAFEGSRAGQIWRDVG